VSFNLVNHQISSDFYQGWLIEISSTAEGFQLVCYSPCREKIRDFVNYRSEIEALQVAKYIVNWQAARQSLSSFLRECFEANGLCFEEWRSLQQSLSETLQAH
jgi:hypothetical protein